MATTDGSTVHTRRAPQQRRREKCEQLARPAELPADDDSEHSGTLQVLPGDPTVASPVSHLNANSCCLMRDGGEGLKGGLEVGADHVDVR